MASDIAALVATNAASTPAGTEEGAEVHLVALDLISKISGYRYSCVTETVLQEGLEELFTRESIAFTRELVMPGFDRFDRPDFFIAPGLVVEVKIKGSFAQLLRQCARYAEHDAVKVILVVGTPYWIPTLPANVGGKPLYHLRLIGSLI
jgi:hypothetical protein